MRAFGELRHARDIRVFLSHLQSVDAARIVDCRFETEIPGPWKMLLSLGKHLKHLPPWSMQWESWWANASLWTNREAPRK